MQLHKSSIANRASAHESSPSALLSCTARDDKHGHAVLTNHIRCRQQQIHHRKMALIDSNQERGSEASGHLLQLLAVSIHYNGEQGIVWWDIWFPPSGRSLGFWSLPIQPPLLP